MRTRPNNSIDELLAALRSSDPRDSGSVAVRILDRVAADRAAIGRAPAGLPVAPFRRWLIRRRETGFRRAEQAVAGAFDRFDAPHRDAVAERLGARLHPLAADLIRSGAEPDRLAGLAIAGHTRDIAMLPFAAGLVGGEPAAVSRRAVEVVEAIAECAVRLSDPSAPAFRRGLAAVLDAAAEPLASADRAILRAVLVLLTPAVRAGAAGPHAEGWLDRAPEATRLALRSAFRGLVGATGTDRALELLERVELRRAAAERIASATTREERRALRERSHLTLRPCRSAALRSRVDRSDIERLAGDDADDLTVSEARGLPRWLRAIGCPEEHRTRALEPLLAHADAAARLAAVHAGTPALALDQCLDPSRAVACSAAVRLAMPAEARAGTKPIEVEAHRLLERSPHSDVRRLARRLPVAGDRSAVSLVNARLQHRRNPAASCGAFAGRIEAGDTDAIAIVARLGIADDLLGPLAGALSGDDCRVAATAARSLAGARSPEAGELLAKAMGHDDPRVRSNAIEAAAARARRYRTNAPPIPAEDPHHRPLATAIRVLLQSGVETDRACSRVQGLLTSDDPARRAAGLWVTERAAPELKPVAGRSWADIAARVAESARRGESEHERRRATRCARRMLAVTRA